MPDTADIELLRDYARRDSETAFAELVRRHINLVYSVALRYVGCVEDAQDVTQAVFIVLARKSVRLGPRTVLTGWLYDATRFTAARLLRNKVRRQAREQEAYMQTTLNDPNSDEIWPQLAPHLEAAMTQLSEKDRTLLVLRFYENKSAGEAATLLGIQEQAAHKRTARALEKLRRFFSRRGTMLSATMIAAAISGNAVHAAPIGLAVSVAAVAAKGTAATASTLALVKGTLKMMTWIKYRFAVGVGTAVLLVGSVATIALSGHKGAEPNGQHYQTTGTAHVKGMGQDITYRFTLAVEGPQWCLRATEHREKGVVETNIFDYIESGYDGDSVYEVHSMETIARANPDTANVAVATISKGSVPSDADTLVKNLWLGLASHCYFASASSKWLYPLFLGRQTAAAVDGRFAVKGFWSTLPGSPGLPSKVVYTFAFDGKLRNTAPNVTDLSNRTNVIMTALSQRTDDGLVLPAKYKTEAYSPEGRLTYETDVEVESATNVVTLRVFRPTLPGPTAISDFRLDQGDASAAPVTYISTNWLTVEKAVRFHPPKMSQDVQKGEQ